MVFSLVDHSAHSVVASINSSQYSAVELYVRFVQIILSYQSLEYYFCISNVCLFGPKRWNICNTRSSQVNKLCTLAHIELAPDGEGLDAAAVQRDVGAMLRCMQTMRGGEDGDRDGRVDEGAGGGGDVVEDEGPWGGAMKWQAPLHEVRARCREDNLCRRQLLDFLSLQIDAWCGEARSRFG